jgi:hypothetical protein
MLGPATSLHPDPGSSDRSCRLQGSGGALVIIAGAPSTWIHGDCTTEVHCRVLQSLHVLVKLTMVTMATVNYVRYLKHEQFRPVPKTLEHPTDMV